MQRQTRSRLQAIMLWLAYPGLVGRGSGLPKTVTPYWSMFFLAPDLRLSFQRERQWVKTRQVRTALMLASGGIRRTARDTLAAQAQRATVRSVRPRTRGRRGRSVQRSTGTTLGSDLKTSSAAVHRNQKLGVVKFALAQQAGKLPTTNKKQEI